MTNYNQNRNQLYTLILESVDELNTLEDFLENWRDVITSQDNIDSPQSELDALAFVLRSADFKGDRAVDFLKYLLESNLPIAPASWEAFSAEN